MPRPRSQATHDAKRRLLQRLTDGSFRPGDRFYSNRAVARIFGISYQTAHRLLDELVEEGHLRRAPSSGTYVEGPLEVMTGVDLLFHPRAKREGSFGHRLLEVLVSALEREGIAYRVRFGTGVKPEAGAYPVVWECAGALDGWARAGCYGLLLHEDAPPGMRASFVDSITVDDFSGGLAAAEWLGMQVGVQRVAVLAGPLTDARSQRRVDGFCSQFPNARVVWADGWYLEDGLRAAEGVAGVDGVFCGNDRLAEALIRYCGGHRIALPRIIGFDDAPVAWELGFATVAIPWDEIAGAAVRIAVRRLTGDPHPAARTQFSPRPVMRGNR